MSQARYWMMHGGEWEASRQALQEAEERVESMAPGSSQQRFQRGALQAALAHWMAQTRVDLSACLRVALEALTLRKDSLLLYTAPSSSSSPSSPSASLASPFLPLAAQPPLLWQYIRAVGESYEQVGGLYERQGQVDLAEAYLAQGYKLGRLFHVGHLTAHFLLRLSELFYQQHQWARAASSLDQLSAHLQRTPLPLSSSSSSSSTSSALSEGETEGAAPASDSANATALSAVSPFARRWMEILVAVRRGDLALKRHQATCQEKAHGWGKGWGWEAMPRSQEKAIRAHYQQALLWIEELQAHPHRQQVDPWVMMMHGDHSPSPSSLPPDALTRPPEESLYHVLTGGRSLARGTGPRAGASTEPLRPTMGLWEVMTARVQSKMARLDMAQGQWATAGKTWKRLLASCTGHPWMRASLMHALSLYYLLQEGDRTPTPLIDLAPAPPASSSSKPTRTRLTRSNTAPAPSHMAPTRRAIKESAPTLSLGVRKAQKLLVGAYELVRETAPPRLMEAIVRALLVTLARGWGRESASEQENVFYLLNEAQHITTRHKLIARYGSPSSSSPSPRGEEEVEALTHQLAQLIVREKWPEPAPPLAPTLALEATVALRLGEALPRTYRTQQLAHLPPTWTVCNLSLSADGRQLWMSRVRGGQAPVCVCIPWEEGLLRDLQAIMRANHASMQPCGPEQSKEAWWEVRKKLDLRLATLLHHLQEHVLGCWKGLLRGLPHDAPRLEECVQRVRAQVKKGSRVEEGLVRLYLESFDALSGPERTQLMQATWKGQSGCQAEVQKIFLKERVSLSSPLRHPTILVLDPALQMIPWESMPLLYSLPLSRVPSLAVLSQLLYSHHHHHHHHHQHHHQKGDSLSSSSPSPHRLEQAYYLINPNEDPRLVPTQERLAGSFQEQRGWRGLVGKRPPRPTTLLTTLQRSDLYIYCGHGSSEKYVDRTLVEGAAPAQPMPVSLLMGCSSGKLAEAGEYDPSGFALSLLVAGAPAAVGYLWDVTDRDCDIICASILQRITQRAEFCQDLLASAQKNPTRLLSIWKKLEWSGVGTSLPSVALGASTTLAQSVALAKRWAYLPYLNGAALVAYGLPLDLASSSSSS